MPCAAATAVRFGKIVSGRRATSRSCAAQHPPPLRYSQHRPRGVRAAFDADVIAGTARRSYRSVAAATCGSPTSYSQTTLTPHPIRRSRRTTFAPRRRLRSQKHRCTKTTAFHCGKTMSGVLGSSARCSRKRRPRPLNRRRSMISGAVSRLGRDSIACRRCVGVKLSTIPACRSSASTASRGYAGHRSLSPRPDRCCAPRLRKGNAVLSWQDSAPRSRHRCRRPPALPRFTDIQSSPGTSMRCV